jgi:hypothetical protein
MLGQRIEHELEEHELDRSQVEVSLNLRAAGDENHGRMVWGAGDTFEYSAPDLGPGVLRLEREGDISLVPEGEVTEATITVRDG